MRKLILSVLVCLALFSCSQNDVNEDIGTQSLNANIEKKNLSKEVSLIKAWKSDAFYRGSATYDNKFTVRVANLAPEKKVSIYHERLDGNWDEIPLSFEMQIDDNSEIWTGEFRESGFGITKTYADEFVVRYEVNGEVYWDNNSAQNYVMSEENGYFFADPNLFVSLDQDDTIFTFQPSFNMNDFRISVDVKNMARVKDVQVVYTTDGWNTKKNVKLSYAEFFSIGALSRISSPNSYDVERWVGDAQFDRSVTSIEYAVVYRVNGKEYWDNNYGKNYVIDL